MTPATMETAEPRWIGISVSKMPLFVLLCALLNAGVRGSAHAYNLPEHRKLGDGLQYGAIVDAGSSGSRVRVYAWNVTNNKHWAPSVYTSVRHLYPLPPMRMQYSFKVRPGLARLAANQTEVTSHVMKLLRRAKNAVPVSVHSVTEFYFMATAGMRLLLEDNANDVIDKIDSILSDPSVNPFHYESTNTRILSGEEEGVFAWITVNYLRGFFNAEEGAMESMGIMELGGASTQIAFVPEGSVLADKFPVKIAGVIYPLYVHSYLYYGQDYTEKWVKEYLYKQNTGSTIYGFPCFPLDAFSVDMIDGRNVTFKGTGQPQACMDILHELVYHVEDYRCYPKPCAIGSVYQPTIADAKLFIATSAFLLALDPIEGAVEEDGTFVPEDVIRATEIFCGKDIKRLENETGHYGDRYLPTSCLMGLYIPLLLTKGYGFSNSSRQTKALAEVNGQPSEWTMGAIIYENERKDWECSPGYGNSAPAVARTGVSMAITLLLGIWTPLLGAIWNSSLGSVV